MSNLTPYYFLFIHKLIYYIRSLGGKSYVQSVVVSGDVSTLVRVE